MLRVIWNKYGMLFLILIPSFIFNMLMVNKTFAITDGWFQDFNFYINMGYIPYRDFYCPIPPGMLIITHILSTIWNDNIIVLHYYGIVERMVLISVLYLIMERIFKEKVLYLSVLIASFIYIGNMQDVFFSYYQSALICIFAGLYCVIKLLEGNQNFYLYESLFGIFMGISILMKQNLGGLTAITLGLFLLIKLWKQYRWKALYGSFVSLVSALIICVFPLVFLYYNNALNDFFLQIFKGASSKGSIVNIFWGFIPRIMNYKSLFILISLIVCCYSYKKSISSTNSSSFIYRSIFTILSPLLLFFSILRPLQVNYGITGEYIVALFLLVFISLITTFFYIKPFRNKDIFAVVGSLFVIMVIGLVQLHQFININYIVFRDYRVLTIDALFFLSIIWIIYLIRNFNSLKGTNNSIKIAILLCSTSILYAHGMSGVLEEHGTLLLFSMLIGQCLYGRVKYQPYIVLLIVFWGYTNIFAINVQRNNMPYQWWGVNKVASSYDCNYIYQDPKLKGLLGSQSAVNSLDKIYNLVHDNKKAGDTIYSFPHINYFNVMAGLPSPTFGKVHYFDVCPDFIASQDAAILLERKPTFIIWMEMPESTWETHEELFRDKGRSGQRDIQQSVNYLVSSNEYILLGEYNIDNSDPIYIYGLKDGRDWKY